jgi:hypothetical protein
MKRNQLSIFLKHFSHSAGPKEQCFETLLALKTNARHAGCFTSKAIIAASAIMIASGLFAVQAPKAYAESTAAAQTTQATDDQAQRIQMQATINNLQKTIAELTARVQAKQAAAPARTMTLPQIAAEVQRIAKEKEILAQKVQAYLAAHPQTATVGQAAPADAANASAKIAKIKNEINALTEKLMAQKAGTQTDATIKVETAKPAEKNEKPEETPAGTAGQPAEATAETTKTEPSAPAEGTPEITITPEGDVAANGEKQGITVSTQNPKKGLFQLIGDYIASLFKF